MRLDVLIRPCKEKEVGKKRKKGNEKQQSRNEGTADSSFASAIFLPPPRGIVLVTEGLEECFSFGGAGGVYSHREQGKRAGVLAKGLARIPGRSLRFT